MSRMLLSPHRAFLCLSLAVALAACAAPLEVQQTGTEERYRETETIPIDNCGGPGEVTVHRLMSNSVRHDVYVDVGTEVNLSAAIISAALLETYGYREGQEEVRTIGVDLTAPPNSKVTYTLEWTEVWVKGVAYDPVTGETTGAWRLCEDVTLQIIDISTEACR